MTDRTHPDSGRIITSSDILLHDAETALLYEELRAAIDDGHESMTHADALAEIAAIRAENEKLHAQLEAIGAGGVSGPLMGRTAPPTAQAEGWTATAQHQTYRCKIKSRKQIDKEIPRDQQGWWADVAAGQKLLLRPAVQADIDRCHLGGRRSKNPDGYMCETQTNGSLVSKIALEYMHPEQNVFAAVPHPPTSAEGVEHG